jgi:hypothetical protein
MFLAAGIALYFAAQGAGRVGLPILVASVRLVVVVGCGLIVVAAGAPLAALFAVIALGIVLYGGLSAAAIKRTSW